MSSRGNQPRYEKPKPTTAEEVVERAMQSGRLSMDLVEIALLSAGASSPCCSRAACGSRSR